MKLSLIILLTASAVLAQPPALSRPAQGESVLDPSYGTKIIRISGPKQQARTPVCTMPTNPAMFNSDGTRMNFLCCDTPTGCNTSTKWVANLGADGVPTSIVALSRYVGYDIAAWSPVDPDVFYYLQNDRLRSYDIGTRKSTTIKDFNFRLSRLSVSDDEDVFVMARLTEDYGENGMVAWKRSTGTTLFSKTAADEGWAGAKPSGHPNGLYAWTSTWRVNQGDPYQTCLIDLTAGTYECHAGSSTWRTGHGTYLDDYWVHVEGWDNSIIRANVPAWNTYTTLFNSFTSWNREVHMTSNGDQDTVAVGVQPGCPWNGTTYNNWENEIFTLPVAGGSPSHIAWNRINPCSGSTQLYNFLARPQFSRNGRFIAFASNWIGEVDSDTTANVYLLDLETSPPPARD